MSNVHFFGQTISWGRAWVVVVIGAVTVLCATTVGEFAVSVHNRYSVYPVGTDTNMYANSGIGQGVVCLVAAVAIGYVMRKRLDKKLIAIAAILFFVFMIASSHVQSFVPVGWCRYELTMYSCDDGLGHGGSLRP
ncbi:MAG: hypothetical protein KBD66_01515 [Candidatus Doudnabacteria bacterium]|nr:hypothetical protein [Candidatus Doudnabacteria bacterium]